MKQRDLASLFQQFREGDMEAYKTLYYHFFPAFIKYGSSMGFSEVASEDQVQELFIWLWKNRTQLIPSDNIESYIYAAFRNNLLNQKRINSRRKQIIQSLDRTKKDRVSQTPALEQGENSEILSRLLDELPQQQREVIYLRYYEEKSIAQISEIMSLAPQIVSNYAYRALIKLRRHSQELKHLLYPLIAMLMQI